MAFAQDVPFHVEVLAQSARMRWGPGPTYVVQHYANAGHVLLVLDVDADSDPPWTWYYARTPSGAQSWIRSDLVRRRDDGTVPVEQRVSNPTGNYPVRDDNFCNTNLFRPCQEGADHQLWEAGYWARNRYNHWESGGWDLNTVYYLNPCREDRVCPRREDWDSGRLEAEMLAVTLTPDATLTPLVILQTVVGERQIWQTLTGTTGPAVQLLHRTAADASELYDPPPEMRTPGDTSSIVGGFRLNRESVSANCQYWYLTESDALVGPVKVNVNISRLPEDATDDPEHESQIQCFNRDIGETDVVARKWEITLTRSYSGFGAISVHRWRLTATFGSEPPDECERGSCGTKAELADNVRTYLGLYRSGQVQPTEPAPAQPGIRVERPLDFITPSAAECTRQTQTQGESPNERTRLEYTCTAAAGNLSHNLTFQYTHDESRPFVRPTTCPDTNNDGEPDCL